MWFRRCGAQVRDAEPDRAAIDCVDQVPCVNEDVDERYFVWVCVSCVSFLAVDDTDTCTGRYCAVESDSRSYAGFCESHNSVFPRSSRFVGLLVLAMTMSKSLSPKNTREAAQQFTLVARGLEGTSFGYTSVIF